MADHIRATIFIVEPRLRTASGHEFEHAITFARAIKTCRATLRVVVLTGPQDATLSALLRAEPAIDEIRGCFPARWLSDWSPRWTLVQGTLQDALRLRRALWQCRGAGRPVLFFDSLDVYRVLLLTFLQLLTPTEKISAMGIIRYDPLHADGTLKAKYAYLRTTWPGRLTAGIGLMNTHLYTDSPVLQTVVREHFQLEARLAPIPVPGVWDLPAEELDRPSSGPVTIGFIGQPRASRAFALFVATALAFEGKRVTGEIRFLAILPPGSLEAWNMAHYRPIFQCRLAGLVLEERVMDSTDFARQMNRADIVWALGDPPDFYRRQTSGIFTHGLCLGKKMITDRGGWAEAAAGPISVCQYVEPRIEQTIAAIIALAISKCDSKSSDCIRQWRAMHSRKSFDGFIASALGDCGV